jgi:hypothetical protein
MEAFPAHTVGRFDNTARGLQVFPSFPGFEEMLIGYV